MVSVGPKCKGRTTYRQLGGRGSFVRLEGVAEDARTRGFATPSFPGCTVPSGSHSVRAGGQKVNWAFSSHGRVALVPNNTRPTRAPAPVSGGRAAVVGGSERPIAPLAHTGRAPTYKVHPFEQTSAWPLDSGRCFPWQLQAHSVRCPGSQTCKSASASSSGSSLTRPASSNPRSRRVAFTIWRVGRAPHASSWRSVSPTRKTSSVSNRKTSPADPDRKTSPTC
jgi:hypothetical protein